MKKTKGYSIVCYLEGEQHNKVRAIQEKLFELTGSRKCLDSWNPHLTIGSGILVAPENQNEVDQLFQDLVNSQTSFEVKLSGFDGITNWKGTREGVTTPYVLWINVEINEQLQNLFQLVADTITSKYETWWPRIINYIPHVTVAYGDLNKEGYEKGMAYLETLQFSDTIRVSHIALVEYSLQKDVEYKRFYFSN